MGVFIAWCTEQLKMADTRYLTINDVARHFGINAATVYRLAQRGTLPGFKVGGQWRFSQAMLESWVVDQVTVERFKAEDQRTTSHKRANRM